MVANSNALRHLGKSDILVTPIGLGMMEFSGGGGFAGMMFPVIPQEQKNEIVKAALDGGINWFDTAEMYGGGVSEQSLAKALKQAGKTKDDVVIATKWMPLLRTAGNLPRTIGNRLKYLGGYPIGLYMVHQPWSFSSPEAEMEAMARLVETGEIRSIGVSNFSPARMERAYKTLQKHGLPLVVNQMRFSLLHREIENDGTLAAAKDMGITIIAYTPLASGILTGKYHRNPELLAKQSFYRRNMMRSELDKSRPLIQAMEEIALKYDATPAQIALNWVIHYHGDIIVTIPGATKVQQAKESASSMNFKLTEEELNRLDQLSKNP